MNWTRGVPVFWLALSGLIGAAAGLYVAWDSAFATTPVFSSLLFAVLGVLFVVDARTTYLPDPWMIIAGTLVVLYPISVAITTDVIAGVFIFMLAGVGASIGFCLFAITRMMTGQIGFGDVKLAAVLGGWLLPIGWLALGLGFVFTALLGAVWVGVAALRGKRSAPYGPAMIAGAILATGLS